MSSRYYSSEQLLERALGSIPLGSQTFSKSKTQYPLGVSPFFVEKGCGARLWDVDGNVYVDYVNGLLSVLLGYQDAEVDAAVRHQMQSGVTFSLPHRLEMEVSEKLVEMIPCAEMVRFGKNGTDATSAAIRLARAYTGRDQVAVCGYHGWQDWYIGSTSRNLGVPAAVRALTHSFQYNNIESLRRVFEQHPGEIAAVILEPMNLEYPQNEFLHQVKDLVASHGALLIFDETITGFRFARGGAQELFEVTPDLATFGKGMGNGYPISAVVGRREVMLLMEKIFYSGTFAGETLSLAATKVVLDKINETNLLFEMHSRGEMVITGLRRIIGRLDADEIFTVSGHPAWSFLNISDAGNCNEWQIRTLFLQEMFTRGILTLCSHNMSCAHGDAEVEQLLNAYEAVLPGLVEAIREERVGSLLRAEPLEPLFKVR
ncbi:aminotransferase class III-fold pyridoxal phosphate-dependent enzyme [Pseudomaricurvus alkylphenolicus]|jgi:glutamate-1-semialdehyde 2,1-aminomutase|uniref:aminotransferase class III-fold pyridoxal phosphate-dependent enzyme n=1 Tax=Pseudomaricurvus alkylphenolicus TaxID=1306991 RepID=UPI001421DF55|nr:aminotransferase class III-fold pyridoxal phosphate-dependent enzyme [Pseudomaricurvus alkylphenolicus]NIB43240.1 aminotransferase class III-fold pyridoxal phosphate-dependent enzyme [Pseudomaricurvus alkylphenolicus]